MQAVILAAGKSTRTYPLTLTRPKPLLKAANKTLLEHNLENLRDFVNDAILVVGYKKNMIKNSIGNNYKNIKIKYVEQKQQLGTAHAVSLVEPHIKGRFVLMMGDDIYSKKDVGKCVKHRYSILTARTKKPENFGIVVEKNSIMVDFVEKPKKFVSDLASTALYVLDRKIFSFIKKIKKSSRNEMEMPDTIKLLALKNKIYIIKAKKWLPVAHPSDLLKADKTLRNNKNFIGDNAIINGTAKNSSIGDGCIIEGIVRGSIVMDGAVIDKNSIVENSVVGENCHISGKISNSVIADKVNIINSAVKNSKIWPNKIIKNKKIWADVK